MKLLTNKKSDYPFVLRLPSHPVKDFKCGLYMGQMCDPSMIPQEWFRLEFSTMGWNQFMEVFAYVRGTFEGPSNGWGWERVFGGTCGTVPQHQACAVEGIGNFGPMEVWTKEPQAGAANLRFELSVTSGELKCP